MNAHSERFFGDLKSECFNRLIFFGERSLRNAVRIYLDHGHCERRHQGLDNKLILPMKHPPDTAKEIISDEKLGGLLRSCRRAA